MNGYARRLAGASTRAYKICIVTFLLGLSQTVFACQPNIFGEQRIFVIAGKDAVWPVTKEHCEFLANNELTLYIVGEAVNQSPLDKSNQPSPVAIGWAFVKLMNKQHVKSQYYSQATTVSTGKATREIAERNEWSSIQKALMDFDYEKAFDDLKSQ